MLTGACRARDTSPTVVKVLVGNRTTKVLTAEGRLFGFGQAELLKLPGGTQERFLRRTNTSAVPYPVPIDPALAPEAGPLPFRVATLEAPPGSHTIDAVEVTASDNTTCVVRPDRTAACWGNNSFGQLGRGDTTLKHDEAPASVAGLVDVQTLGVGFAHGCALLSGGRVACWGGNNADQLGTALPPGKKSAASPVTPTGLPPIRQLAVGAHHTCALAEDGTVLCWGSNWHGQMGNGEHGMDLSVATPTRVPGLTGVEALVSSPFSEHTCARLADRTATCWGRNEEGQVGNGEGGADRLATRPSPVLGLHRVTVIATGADHTCALVDPGRLYCWGEDDHGQVGGGGSGWVSSTRSKPVPVRWK